MSRMCGCDANELSTITARSIGSLVRPARSTSRGLPVLLDDEIGDVEAADRMARLVEHADVRRLLGRLGGGGVSEDCPRHHGEQPDGRTHRARPREGRGRRPRGEVPAAAEYRDRRPVGSSPSVPRTCCNSETCGRRIAAMSKRMLVMVLALVAAGGRWRAGLYLFDVEDPRRGRGLRGQTQAEERIRHGRRVRHARARPRPGRAGRQPAGRAAVMAWRLGRERGQAVTSLANLSSAGPGLRDGRDPGRRPGLRRRPPARLVAHRASSSDFCSVWSPASSTSSAPQGSGARGIEDWQIDD